MDLARAREYLKALDFESLFIEELGWDTLRTKTEVSVDGQKFGLAGVAEKHGMAVLVCTPRDADASPDYQTRLKIERQVVKLVHEHILVFVDKDKGTQVWQWVKREPGRPAACREHTLYPNQSGEALLQKLQAVAFSLEEEAGIAIRDVTSRVRTAFDVERVTKRFYGQFKTEHDAFLVFIKGIPDKDMHRWYVSVMLNRLMFIYFVQKKGFLNSNPDYLRDRLVQSKQRGKDRFYRGFLCALFFKGFARKEEDRSAATRKLLGRVPYLNGGIFQVHEIEDRYGKEIRITDAAFDKLFAFFDQYQWHLDEHPLRNDNEINPDVLGYIFEKYINQKQMGAYYTKEDITGYISRNTVVPRIFDMARNKCRVAFEGEQSVWRLLQTDPDRYIYDAVRKGVIDKAGDVIPESRLPDFVQKGMHDPKARMFDKRYNLGDAELLDDDGNKLTLPTETWREYVARRTRCLELRQKLAAGETRDINDLITYNLDICQFAQDVVEQSEGPELLRAVWRAIAGRVPDKSNLKPESGISVLDPACGSGAFLFAALNILEVLYEACLDRMQTFLDELESSGKKHRADKYKDFRDVLERVSRHTSRKYFVFKSIIINNLFGVDIMDEAVEICKLRLFLKLAAQVEPDPNKDNLGIEPLPDIDFNIRAGNTLVGYATESDVAQALYKTETVKQTGFVYGEHEDALANIRVRLEDLQQAFDVFRKRQLETEKRQAVPEGDKKKVEAQRDAVNQELSPYLARWFAEKNVKTQAAFRAWLKSHKPFHWFVEFHGIMKSGGFDVIIGNPPFVEYSKVRDEYSIKGYATAECGNLYAYVVERAFGLLRRQGCFCLVLPISFGCTQRMASAQAFVNGPRRTAWLSSYAERPSKLFTGAEVLLTIAVVRNGTNDSSVFSTGLTKWASEERGVLFQRIVYENAGRPLRPYVLPKISSGLERAIVEKLETLPGRLGSSFVKRSSTRIYYRIGGGRYWKIYTDFQPRFVLNGKKSVSSRENYLYFGSAAQRDSAIAVLSSTLFYWYFMLTTNGRDLNPIDLREFPVGVDGFASAESSALGRLCSRLMVDYRTNSAMLKKTSLKTGQIEYQEFYPRKSKTGIIDRIDQMLAKHYGFTDEELDFIINYDIKYRMGRGAGDAKEE